MNSKFVIPTTFKGVSDNHGRLHPQLALTGTVFLYDTFGHSQKETEKWLRHIAPFGMNLTLLGWSRSGVAAGVGVGVDIFRSELESESLKIQP